MARDSALDGVSAGPAPAEEQLRLGDGRRLASSQDRRSEGEGHLIIFSRIEEIMRELAGSAP